jgi:hypothetical protein
MLIAVCRPLLPSSPTDNDKTVQIRVECRNESQVVDQVIQALRVIRISDLEKESDGLLYFVRARYKELSEEKEIQITDYIKRIPGVLDVVVVRDGLPVKNSTQ